MLGTLISIPFLPAGHITFLKQLIQQAAPFLSEQVGARQTAVPTNHAQVGDTALHQVECCFKSALVGAEFFTAGAANDGASLGRSNHTYQSHTAHNSFVTDVGDSKESSSV